MPDEKNPADDTVTASIEGTVSESRTAVVRLTSVLDEEDYDVRLAGRALVDVLRRIEDLALISFRIRSVGGRLSAGIVVESFDAETAMAAAARIRLAIEALAPNLRFETVELAADDALVLPATPKWASRVVKGEVTDEKVRAGGFSPLARALANVDALVSISVASSGGGLTSDIVLVSDDAPTDVLAALLTAELNSESNIQIESAHGPDAAEIVSTHHRPRQPVNVAAFGDVFSIPARTDVEAEWSRQPVESVEPAATVAALQSAPQLHRWLLGRTGMGKTTLMRHLIESDIDAGKTVVVIDPHGDLAASIAEHHAGSDRLHYVDFAANEPPTLNPLQTEPGQLYDAACDDFMETLRTMWDDLGSEYFGPVYERAMRTAFMAVSQYGRTGTVAELVRFLQGHNETVKDVVGRARDDGHREYLDVMASELSNLGAAPGNGDSASMSTYVLSKLETMIGDARVRRIVDARRSSLTVTDAVRDGSILVVRCPVGWIGVPGTRMLTQLIISRLMGVIGRRFEAGRDGERPPVAVYIDEWVLVAQSPIQRILAEGRKFGFELTISNQSLQQIAKPLQVAANVGTLALFRVGPQEAGLFSDEFEDVNAKTLRTLPPYFVAVRNPHGIETVGVSPIFCG